jgi:hypothetical protein
MITKLIPPLLLTGESKKKRLVLIQAIQFAPHEEYASLEASGCSRGPLCNSSCSASAGAQCEVRMICKCTVAAQS